MSKVLLIISLMILSISSTLYSVGPDFTVTYQKSSDQLGHCYYDLKHNSQGWNYLRIYTNIDKDLNEQHRGAGFLQGYVTYKQINYAYKNFQSSILKNQQMKPSLVNFLNEQIDYIDSMTQSHPKDIFWQYSYAKMEQLRFMYRGFLTRINLENRLDLYLTFMQFYAITNIGDLQDLIPAYQEDPFEKQENKQENMNKQNKQENKIKEQEILTQQQKINLMKQSQTKRNCNGIAKIVNDSIVVGHSTHNIYQFMLRIYKTYNFPTRNSRVGSQTLSFSSRPGDLISKDDFYVLSSGLIVFETSFSNMNKDNLKQLRTRTVPTWLRQTIACHLARTVQEWIDYFIKQRSGTHNNQWVIIDPSKLSNKQKIIYFVQDAFSQFQVTDMTQMLLKDGYVASYNVPYNQKISDKLGYQYYPYDYNNDPRANIYRKINSSLLTQEDMKAWLITNQQQTVDSGLAPRYDLLEKDSKPFGLTDCKIVTVNTLKQNYIWAINGPTLSNGRFKPFQWKQYPTHSHLGMPDKFDFPWVKVLIHQNQQLHLIQLQKMYAEM